MAPLERADGMTGQSTPILSSHATTRLRQRGLSLNDMALVRVYGEEVADGFVMSNKSLDKRRQELLKELQRLERLRGVAVIEADPTVITVSSRQAARENVATGT